MKYYSELIHFLPSHSLVLILIGLIFVSTGIYCSIKTQNKTIIYSLLFIGFMTIGSGFATIDPYLHEWDEQYHALVARNLSNDPLHPKLIVHSPLKIDYKIWTYTEIWLHKQPLFLWQIALSIKTFGASVWAVRFPSVLLHALTALLVFSIGKRFLKPTLAVLACVLFGCSGYYNDYTSGAIGMDHNDVAFVFYVTASFWAWFKYREATNRRKWIALIGVFSGCAVMCKWLVGLIVFSGWGTLILMENWKDLRSWIDLLKSFAVTVLIVFPWQLYCYLKYPKEYLYEMTYNSKHFTHALEMHGGDAFFYWNLMDDSFGSGELIRWIIVIGLLLFVYKSIKNKGNWLFATIVFLTTYLFFTIAATKLQGYVTIVASFGFIFLVYPFEVLFNYLQSKKKLNVSSAISTVLILVVLFFHFSPKGVVERHKYENPTYRETRIHELNASIAVIKSASHFDGYFILKGNKSNILTSLIYLTNAKVIYYNYFSEGKIADKKNYYLIDLTESGGESARPNPY